MKTFVLLLMIPAAILIQGTVLSILWGWFMVPTFGLPAIGFSTAAGLSLLIHSGGKHKTALDTMEEIVQYGIERLVVVPLFTLAIGWVLTKIV